MSQSRPTNLIICGGGVNGVALLGAAIELTEKNHLQDLKRVAGTSAGAMVALGVALNFNADDLREFLSQFDASKLLNRSSWLTTPAAFFKKFGIFDHRYAHHLINRYIAKKTQLGEGATFADFQAVKTKYGLRDLYVTATNISKRITVVFSHETSPNVRIADAIYASMAVPILFGTIAFSIDPNGLLIRDKNGDIFGDGAILNNYALHLFDLYKYMEGNFGSENPNDYVCNPHTLGLCLVDNKRKIRWITHGEPPAAAPLPTIFHHAATVSEMIVMEQRLEMLRNSPVDSKRTIFISTEGNSPLNFLQTDKVNKVLTTSGQEAASQHINQSTSSTNKPLRSKL